MAVTPAGSQFDQAVAAVRAGSSVEAEAETLFEAMTESERLGLLDGDLSIWQGLGLIHKEGYNARPYTMGEVDRLGLPGIRFVDGPRGCVAGQGTAFPVPMARGATWDVSLEEAVGTVIGQEVRAQGGNFFGGICINLPRHPSWGRVQETYGDEPYHLGEFGAALARGVQPYAMTCAKHLALNSMENARFKVDVTIAPADLHDMYLPHFRRLADQGVSAVMSAYNSVNGEWAGQNAELLTDILRDQWHWSGFTISDFVFGIRDAGKSLNAGLDVEAPFAMQRFFHLTPQLAAGQVSQDAVRRSGLRVIEGQLRSYASRRDGEFPVASMASPASRAFARKVASRAMVLLKNESVGGAPILPLAETVRSIALIGRLAAARNMGDRGSSDVRAPSYVTPHEGLTAAFPDAEILLVTTDDPVTAAAAARAADMALVVAGYDDHDEGEYAGAALAAPEIQALFPPPPPGMSTRSSAETSESGPSPVGEGGDRLSLTLRAIDEDIILAVAAANPRTAVAIVAGGAVIMERWRARVPSILMMWYAGIEGGHALADIISGRAEPAGRLPFSIPKSAKHLPHYDKDAAAITYDRFHGQRLLDKLGVAAAFPHGFGLGYAEVKITDARITAVTETGCLIEATVTNLSSQDSRHVVQIYGESDQQPYAGQRLLTGFASVAVPAQSSVIARIAADFLPLAHWDEDSGARILPSKEYVSLAVSAYATDPDAITLNLYR